MATERTSRVDELVRVRMDDVPAAEGTSFAYPDSGQVTGHVRWLLQQANDEVSEGKAIEAAKVLLWARNCVETLDYVEAVADGMGFAKAPPPES